MESRASQIPNFIEAGSPRELVSLCLKNNLRLGMYVHYQIVQDVKSGKWLAWYYEDVTDAVLSQSFRKAGKK
jgi:hypothetical protein